MKARAQEKTGIRANNPKEKRRKELLHQGEGACTTRAHRVGLQERRWIEPK
jgi:hypothetical protein